MLRQNSALLRWGRSLGTGRANFVQRFVFLALGRNAPARCASCGQGQTCCSSRIELEANDNARQLKSARLRRSSLALSSSTGFWKFVVEICVRAIARRHLQRCLGQKKISRVLADCGRAPRTFGLRAQHADYCAPLGKLSEFQDSVSERLRRWT